MSQGAGIVFLTGDNRVLLLQRGPEGDFPGTWAPPGGTVEDGETTEAAAVREVAEECGACPDGERRPLSRSTIVPGVEFTTYLQKIDEPFDVVTNAESSGYAWALVDNPPEPLHPGARVALAKLNANELDVARMMVAGDLASPQLYANVAMFCIRITGTGVAFRESRNEYCFRDPKDYLTDDFLARCSGLPVIWDHPENANLDSKEFADRVVGTVFVPYIGGAKLDEVWAVAKVWDAAAIDLLTNGNFSTSPNVSFFEIDPSRKFKREDGTTVFIEGAPDLLDHIAICDNGVWDKGGPPKGVDNGSRGDSVAKYEITDRYGTYNVNASSESEAILAYAKKAKISSIDFKNAADLKRQNDLVIERADSMDPENDRKDAEEKEAREREDKSRKDSDDKLDKLMDMLGGVKSCMDSVSARMDSFEVKEKAREDARKDSEEKEKKEREDKARKDAEEDVERKAADRARKDAEKEEKEKKEEREKTERDDSARADSVASLRKEIDELRALHRPISDEDVAIMSAEQVRADAVYSQFGQKAKRFVSGETPKAYRARLAGEMKQHSKTWKSKDLRGLSEDVLEIAADQIYADAIVAARNPVDLGANEMRMVERIDDAGRKVREYHGQPRAWMSQFCARPHVTGLSAPKA